MWSKSGYLKLGPSPHALSVTDLRLTVEENDAVNNAVTYVMELIHLTSGTPANGIGTGLRFQTETAPGNVEIGATIEAICTDVTPTSEDFDIIFKTMSVGAAAAEKMRLTSQGVMHTLEALLLNHNADVLLDSFPTRFQMTFDPSTDWGATFIGYGANGSTPAQAFGKSRGVNIGDFGDLVNGDSIGSYWFYGTIDGGWVNSARWNVSTYGISSGIIPARSEFRLLSTSGLNRICFTTYPEIGSGALGIGLPTTIDPSRSLHVRHAGVGTSTVEPVARFAFESTGTPANGIGVSVEFEVETSVSNNEIGAIIEAVVTDVTSTSEDFDLILKTMAAGATAAERARFKSTGGHALGGFAGVYSDAGFDALYGWDDSAGTYKSLLLADYAVEGSPAAGDFVVLIGAEGDLRVVNWNSLPGAGGGISNISEDASPTLGGHLEGASFTIGTSGSPVEGVFIEASGFIELGHATDTTLTRSAAGILAVEGVDVVTLSAAQTLTSKTLTSPVLTTPQINDTSADHQYIFAVSELADDRTVTLPLLGGNDTFVFADFIQTLTNKTIDLTSNTLVGSVAEFNAALESADFYTTGGTDVALADGGTGASLVDPNADRLFFWDDSAGSTAFMTVGPGLAVAGVGGTTIVSIVKGQIFGLTLTTNGAGDVTIEAGEATDEAGTDLLVLPAAITKQLSASTFVVGTNQPGLNTGAEAANTWYEVILIKRVDTGVVDVMLSTTANRATLPANYTLLRRIGWIRNDAGSNILNFTQINNHFTLLTQINDASITATATAAAITVTVPPNCIGRFRISSDSNTDNAVNQVTVFSEIVEGNVTPSDTTGIASIGVHDIAGSQASHMELRVSATSTIEHDSSHTANVVDVSTFGWIDHRRQMSAI